MAAPCRSLLTILRLKPQYGKICDSSRVFSFQTDSFRRHYANKVGKSPRKPATSVPPAERNINENVRSTQDENDRLQHTEIKTLKSEDTKDAVLYEEEADVLYRKLVVEVKGHEKAVLDSYQYFVTFTSKNLGLNNLSVTTPRPHIDRMSLLRSVHIFKKQQAQYEQRTFFRVFTKVTGSTADTLLEYIQRNLPEGVAMKVTKHRLEVLPSHLKAPSTKKVSSTSSS